MFGLIDMGLVGKEGSLVIGEGNEGSIIFGERARVWVISVLSDIGAEFSLLEIRGEIEVVCIGN